MNREFNARLGVKKAAGQLGDDGGVGGHRAKPFNLGIGIQRGKGVAHGHLSRKGVKQKPQAVGHVASAGVEGLDLQVPRGKGDGVGSRRLGCDALQNIKD